jgi:endoglucanase
MITCTKHSAWFGMLAVSACLGTTGCAMSVAADDSSESTGESSLELGSSQTRFYVPPPNPGAVKQAVELLRHGHLREAALLAKMATTPQAVWFSEGTPRAVKADVKKTMAAAALTHTVPVLVTYNIPFRDCAQYSAGGALDTAAYKAWIDSFAAGIGKGNAVVILEPDSLGIIPYNKTIFGAEDWCKPTVVDDQGNSVPAPGATAEERYAQLAYALESIRAAAPNAAVYLDGTHSAWLGVSEAAHRLYKAGFRDGAQRMHGFYLNISNYQPTSELTQFGTWVSMCLAAGTPGVGPDWMRDATTGVPHFDWCPGQYDPATNYATVNFTPEFAAGITAGIQGLMGGASPQVKFVLDTSRNGKGAWSPPATASYPDAQVWCNPPARGLGPRPTTETGNELAAAYLWVKIPGESDGSCNRGVTGATTDPEWSGRLDPAAGAWFPAQALELAKLATPPLF